ncbi:hypothetical protein COU60_01735 [Candidatus Pacearchaeota archaeon CG10_big_fil_rev_8_21_14_0_10_34_76]|nr:MAG: hypothetical protein COU60_01735 [Candidatus Pacearchaeota archaeon CG10_big_fil_rev_8_21_14_0_10_34_76]
MEIVILNEQKDDIEMKIDNLTVAEILRAYLSETSGVDFVAWRRDHISKPALLKIKSSGKTVKKAMNEAIVAIIKDSEKVMAELKK